MKIIEQFTGELDFFNKINNKTQQYIVDLNVFDYTYGILDENLKTQRRNDIQVLRGPLPSQKDIESGNYFITIGSAHTFGRFSNKTYGQYLSESLDMPHLNAGISDSSPGLFCNESWLKYINNAKFAIVQIMSGRTGPNDLIEISGGCAKSRDGKRSTMIKLMSDELNKNGGSRVKQLLQQSRQSYIKQFVDLKSKIKVPAIYLWHSVRSPESIDNLDDYDIKLKRDIANFVANDKKNQFPHLLDRTVVNQIINEEDLYVEYVSSKGFPQLFYDKEGERVKIRRKNGLFLITNNYYPTQEQHEEVASLLLQKIKENNVENMV